MAMEAETVGLSPSLPSSFRDLPQPSPEDPLKRTFTLPLDFRVDHKPEEGPEFKSAKLSLPIFETPQQIQHHIDHSLSIQAIYPGLQLAEQGLRWSSLGYDFLMTYQGHLLVVGNLKEEKRAKALRIFNPLGNVYLGNNIALEHLLIKSKNIIQASSAASIGHLEAWATESGFWNAQGAELKTKTFTLHQGSLANLGTLALNSGGKIDLQGADLFNNGQLSLGEGAIAHNIGFLSNKDRIAGTRYRLDVRALENKGSLTGDNIALNVAKRLLNHGTIEGLITTIDTSRATFQNEGEIKASQNLALTVKDGLNRGSLYSSGDSNLDIHGDFATLGNIITEGLQTLTVRKSLGIQEGATVLGKRKLTLRGSGFIENKGTVKSDTQLSILNHTFTNHNLLHSQGSLRLRAKSKFHNTGTGSITAVGKGIISGGGIFQNDTPLPGHTRAGIIFADTLNFNGFRGRVINEGLMTAQGDISGSLHTLNNHGLFGTNALFQGLKIGSFSNRPQGQLREATIAGRGHLIIETGSNQGSIKGLQQLEVASRFANEGALETKQELKIV